MTNTESSSQCGDPDLIATDINDHTVMVSIGRFTYFAMDEANYQKDMQAYVDELLRLSLVQRIN